MKDVRGVLIAAGIMAESTSFLNNDRLRARPPTPHEKAV